MLFRRDYLIPEPFEHRLISLLVKACSELGFAAAGILELVAEKGKLAPAWRVLSSPFEIALPDQSEFDSLVASELDGPSARYTKRLGCPLEGFHLKVIPLSVHPRVTSDIDAAGVFFVRDPNETICSRLVECLEAGLTANREDRLAHVIATAVHSSADAIELTDQSAQLFYVNPAWSRYFGYEGVEVKGRTVGSLFREPVGPLHDSSFYDFTLNSLAEGEPWLGALACRTGSGGQVLCEVNVSPFDASTMGFRGNFAIRRDIASRAGREKALASVHQEFRAVLSAVPDGVVVLKDYQIAFINPALLRVLQRKDNEVIGRTILDFIHVDDRTAFRERLPKEVTGVRIVRKDGAPRFVEISTAGQVSFEGSPAKVVVCRDTTDQRLAEEQLSRSERLNALGAMAGGMAHEINNPLAYAMLNLKQLQAETNVLLPRSSQECLDEAIEGVERIAGIVADLQAFSASDDSGAIETVDVKHAAIAAVNIAQNEIRHRAELSRDLVDNLHIRGREGQLVQVLVNLLLNSTHAISSPDVSTQRITICSRLRDEDTVEILVSDTGEGVPPELLKGIFDPFVTTKRSRGGTGLGLAISKRIVESFGGSIRLESTRGQGTNVIIELPRARMGTRGSTLLPQYSSLKQSFSAKILIVDDEPILVRALHRVLFRHSVVEAVDGESALALLKEDPSFDVILCDVMMPDMPGPALYAEVQQRWPDLAKKFIFITGGAFTDWGREFLQANTNVVLKKPLDAEQLLTAVEAIVCASDDCPPDI